jgi:alkyldihydroxyacetonephosphate synthase
MRLRRFWGWGYEDDGPDPRMLAMAESALPSLLGMTDMRVSPRPRIEEIELRKPRVAIPEDLGSIADASTLERAQHTYGKSYRDLARGIARKFENPPDFVAFPTTEAELVRVLEFCDSNRLAAIPYGGGSSVCGGVEANVGDRYAGAISIDLTRMNRVLELDLASRSAKIQGGALGPVLEDQLEPHGLTLRHYPQSFEFSTLGGWIATRSGGHFATGPTHIDEMVQALRVLTPRGVIETRRLPGDGAGPSAERLFIGSEGILGLITEAWMRVFERPRFRAKASVRFREFVDAMRAVRLLACSGLMPSNCRVLDATEAMLNGAGNGSDSVLLVGFESSDHALEPWMTRALELCRDANGEVVSSQSADDDAARAWKGAFLKAPYLRDELALRGVFVETFETAVTWDRFDSLHARVMSAAEDSARALGGQAIVTCRVTHAYPDGAAPYFTVITPARAGAELEQWQTIKDAITSAMLDAGGTVTHHHAVGRDFRPWYDRQRPELFAQALRAAKRELDPNGVLNPGVLLDSLA